MKKTTLFFVALLLFVFFAAVAIVAQEQSESRPITIRSSEANNGVVILVAREGTNSFELHCNQGMSGCALPEPGSYLMVRLPKNHGVYDCANVDLYRTTPDSGVGDKVGQYCLVGAK